MADPHELGRDAVPESAEHPWEGSGVVRRDCEPHRGKFLRALGMVSLVCGIVGACTPWAAPLAWVTGLPAWILASSDLDAMRAGLKDPSGRALTLAGRSFAITGICLTLLGATCWGLWFAFLWLFGGWEG